MSESVRDMVAVRELPARLAAGPVTLVVPDLTDPCGSRRIARPVRAAVAADVWDTENERMTVGRWKVFFGEEPCTYPMIMVTAGDYRYEVTGEGPGEPGPCGACKALAAREANPSAPVVDSPGLAQEAQERGYDRGYDHANYVDNVGGVDLGWTVPERFASVATYYRAAFEDGMAAYRDRDQDQD